ncbi:unnamed protein product [Microthlaspi erraticum]|uniref:Uncharacterized protein n=1 Tax=Microthlaspi erraticum TaxID=1685480 RepID=A0A6D2ILM0_9BRAS|nr:unnamed protein product [Microthlaspi erraticum]
MEGRFLALSILFLFFLCFPISSDSQKLDRSASLVNQEHVHAEVTIKEIKGEKEDKSIYIFRAGKGSHGVTGGRGGGRKAPPKRNAAMDHLPPLFFSAASVLFTGFIMLSLTSL